MKQIKMTLGFILFTVGIITFTGCSKYEEGPGFSLRTKKSRVAGDWNVTSYTEDGVDAFSTPESGVFDCMSGALIDYTTTTTISNYSYTFDKDGGMKISGDMSLSELDYNTSYDNCAPSYTNTSYNWKDAGKWEFASDKEEIIITYSDGSMDTWKIIELRETEMKLELTYGTSLDKMTLKKK